MSAPTRPVTIPAPRRSVEPKTPPPPPVPDPDWDGLPSSVYALRGIGCLTMAGGWIHLAWLLLAAVTLWAAWHLQDRAERAARRRDRRRLALTARLAGHSLTRT